MEDFNSKYSGEQVEALLDQVASGNAGGGGGGGITVETDPIFSASPAASITEQKIAEWDAKSEQGEKGDKGDTGVGVQSVAQTTTSNADGGSNVVTVTLTDGTKSTFTVKNGSKGSAGTNGVDGATFTPSVDSAGNLSWTNDKGLTNPPTVNIKGPKGDKGDAGEGGGSSTGGGKELVYIGGGVIEELLPNKIYVLEAALEDLVFEIQSIAEPEWVDTPAYAEYTVIIAAEGMIGSITPTIILPENVYWANGVIPDMTEQAYYELSIVYFLGNNSGGFNAVLTPFKPA